MLPAWDNKGFIRSEATGSVTLIASHTPGQQEVLDLSLATYERLYLSIWVWTGGVGALVPLHPWPSVCEPKRKVSGSKARVQRPEQ